MSSPIESPPALTQPMRQTQRKGIVGSDVQSQELPPPPPPPRKRRTIEQPDGDEIFVATQRMSSPIESPPALTQPMRQTQRKGIAGSDVKSQELPPPPPRKRRTIEQPDGDEIFVATQRMSSPIESPPALTQPMRQTQRKEIVGSPPPPRKRRTIEQPDGDEIFVTHRR
ncbi:unnamed protein product [Zymoseptoria tritici ST99CH_1E4]|uniref:Uncharacterized protein n=1 Tax=Zymoseptoria tritici ST99CH_1E4 TaxID=1276532 RepID=A0A2H1HBT3_ZYMTR|nr:unnamed protein product [Zymoseptoria tritici ST99CH_1E4]